jgi:hypothetical protein
MSENNGKRERKGAKMGNGIRTNKERHKKLQQELEELLAEEVEDLDERTRFGYRPGIGRSYILSPRKLQLSPRHKIIADMAAIGIKPSDIARQVKMNPGKSCGGHYNRLLRDPRMEARVNEHLADQVEEAKGILKGVVRKAAENFKEAVENGDMKASKVVLENAQVLSPRVMNNITNVQMNFGDWLKNAEEDKKAIDVSAQDEVPQLTHQNPENDPLGCDVEFEEDCDGFEDDKEDDGQGG